MKIVDKITVALNVYYGNQPSTVKFFGFVFSLCFGERKDRKPDIQAC